MPVAEIDQIKVLVIDDNFDAAETLTSLLQIIGCKADFRTDGSSGVIAALRMVPDFVFLDIGMPIMDGYETARLLRAAPELQQCRLIALTAWGDADTLLKTKACGFHSHLLKPASLKGITSAMKHKRFPSRPEY